MTTRRPITEEDLHGYVDGALDPAQREEVEAYLKLHPDVALRVQAYARQREALQAMLAPIAEEPIPPDLSLTRLAETRRRAPWSLSWRAAAAAILLFGLGGAGGWTMHGLSQAPLTGVAALAHEAAYNYTVYSQERLHPVDFGAADRQSFIDWISRCVNTPVIVPDLSASGYHFMGGRLVATEHGPAGLLMYDNGHGLRLEMLVRQMTKDKTTSTMSQSSEGAMTGFTWARNGVGYSVVAAASAGTLHPIANEIRRQINLNI
jgi:anti-sigma factor RsiW